MNATSLRWAAVALPVAFVVFLRATTDGVLDGVLSSWQSAAIFFGVFSVGCFLFASVVFGWVDRSQHASEARARELQALNDLGGRLTGLMNVDDVIAATLDAASGLLPALAVGIELDRPGLKRWRAGGPHAEELGRLVAARDGDASPPQAQIVGDDGADSLVVRTPLNASGTLYALFDAGQATSLSTLSRLMDGLGRHTTAALKRCELFEDVQRREQRARALYDVGLEIASSQDLSRVLQQVTAHACRLVGARAAALCLVNESDGTLTLAQTAGDAGAILTAPESDVAQIEFVGRPVLTGAAAPACRMQVGAAGYHCIRAHLIAGNAVVGELCVAHQSDHPFSDDEQALLAGLADMAAIAIHNSRLRERERQVAVLEERDHLAREMHDTLAQVLGYLHLKAATTRKRLQTGEVLRATEEVQEMQDLAHEAYVDVREAILGLRETVAPEGGLVGGLRQYLQKFSRQSGIDARLFVPAAVSTALAPDAEIQLLRVVQEALTNVRKHSGAASAAVRIDADGPQLRVTVEDDGTGFDATRVQRDEGRSFGLRSMRERVERAGGCLTVESSPGNGTRIVVLLPLNEGGRHVPYEGAAGR